MNEGLIIYDFYNLPLPRVFLSWQTFCGISSVSTLFVYTLFECIQPAPLGHTLNVRLATPLADIFPFFKKIFHGASNTLVPGSNRSSVGTSMKMVDSFHHSFEI